MKASLVTQIVRTVLWFFNRQIAANLAHIPFMFSYNNRPRRVLYILMIHRGGGGHAQFIFDIFCQHRDQANVQKMQLCVFFFFY